MKRGRKAKPHSIVGGVECKHCGGCDEWLPLDAFRTRPGKSDGLESRCLSCAAASNKAWREHYKATGATSRTRIPEGARYLRVAYLATGKRHWVRLYGVWNAMRGRCNCPGIKDYPRYGGRGIKLCAEWDDYDAFRAWAIRTGYRKHLTIDRIEVNGDYEPDNCEWIPKGDQQLNTRRTHVLTVNGESKTLMEWASFCGMTPDQIRARVNQGWTDEHALTVPLGQRRPAAFLKRPGRKPRIERCSSENEL